MSKYHRNPKTGRIGLCKANGENCPFGDASLHFSTNEEAQVYWDKYDMLETFDEAIRNKHSKTNFLMRLSNIQNKGWDFECYLAASYAEMNDLEQSVVYDNKTNQTWQNTDLSNKELEELKNKLSQKVIEKYSLHSDKSITGDNLIRTIMFNKEKTHFILQLGSPNTTDFAIIKDGELFIGESKKLHGEGSQTSSIAVSKINEDGKLEDSRISDFPLTLQEKIEKFNIEASIGTNYEIPITNEESLEVFVESYKNKGAEMLFFTNSDKKFGAINISGRTKDVTSRMSRMGFEAKTVIRTNKNTKKIQESDLYRIKKDPHGIFNKRIDGESFYLRDLNLDRGGVSSLP